MNYVDTDILAPFTSLLEIIKWCCKSLL